MPIRLRQFPLLLLAVMVASSTTFAVPVMGVYKGARGGSTAPSYSDYAGLRQFETWFGHQIPCSMDFLANSTWSDFDGAASWVSNLTSGWPPQRWRAVYSVPMLPTDGVSTLTQGAAGDYNPHFANLARVLVAAGEGDAIIRLGWEMNGAWYPWHVRNASEAADYRGYWIQIVGTMRGVAGANFKFNFCPINGTNSYSPVNAYPGDDYVDIIGQDVYNTSYQTSDPTARWNELLTQADGLKFWADFATAHAKPLSYPEWATGNRTADTSGGGDDPLFIQNMYTWITTHNVAYHNYWDYQAPDFHGQLSNDQFPNASAKFKELFGPLFANETAAPDKLAATSGNGRIDLAWAAVTGATSYQILRATTVGHDEAPVATCTATTFTDSGLTNGTSYYYVVAAVKSGVASGPSPRATGTPIDASIADDSDPSTVGITGSWTSSTSGDGYYGLDYLHDGNTGATGGKSVRFTPRLGIGGTYNVYARWTAGSNRSSDTPVTITSSDGTSNLIVNQQINGGGWLLLGSAAFAADASGSVLVTNNGTNGYVIADAVAFIATTAPQPPAVPTNVAAAASANQITLTWPEANGAISYEVRRSTAATGAYVTVTTDLHSTTWTDTGLANGVTYWYTVAASNPVGRSADSAPVGAAPVGVPQAPTGLAATPNNAAVTLAWSASPGAASYAIKRATISGGPYATLASSVTATTYTDTAVTNSTAYYYVVTATNTYGESAVSAEVTATPEPQFIVDNADPAGVTVTGAWTVSTSATTFYGPNYLHDGNSGATGGKSVRFTPNLPFAAAVDVYLRWPASSNRASNTPIDITHGLGVTTITVNQRNNDGVWVLLGRFNFAAGNVGSVTVRNDSANGFVIADAAKFVVTGPIATPTAPTNLAGNIGNHAVALTWTAASAATSYTVKRSTTFGGPYTVVSAGVTATNFTDSTPENATTYFYVVSGVSLAGEGPDSNAIAATPTSAAGVSVTYVSSGRTYTVGTALVGAKYTIDRTFSIATLSPALNNATLIRTAYDDKSLTTPTHLTFTVGQASTVYVCYDTRVTTLPGFLDSSWTLTGETITTTHTLASPFKVYAKQFAAGTITLGANAQLPAAGTWGAAGAHYLVLIAPLPPTSASIAFDALSQTYDGTPKTPTITTTPAGLGVAMTYNGSSTPPVSAGSYRVDALITTPGYQGRGAATLLIGPASASLSLGNLSQTYDGTLKSVSVTTSPANLPVNVQYDGTANAPTDAGTYAITATITDPNFTGTASDTLVVNKAETTVALGSLEQTYDGAPKFVSTATIPAGLPVDTTYDGNTAAPTRAGSYAVAAAINDRNYAGSAAGTLIVDKATAAVVLTGLAQRYDGTARSVTAVTTPADLAVSLTYDGGSDAPIYPGAHVVVATVDDPNYAGSATDLLSITATVSVRHAPTLNGMVIGSVQVASAESFALNGSSSVSGDLLVPGTPSVRLNGHPIYGSTLDASGGTLPNGYVVTLNGGATLRHVVRRVDPLSLADVMSPVGPTGTRDVMISQPEQSVGDYSTLRNLTLNGSAGTVALPPGNYGAIVINGGSTLVLGDSAGANPAAYGFQTLTVNGSGHVSVIGAVHLVLAIGGSCNGTIGDAAEPEQLALEIAAGNFTLNGSASVSGSVTASNGAVVLDGSSQLLGAVISDRLIVNGGAVLQQAP